MTPGQAIRKFCVECAGSGQDVKNCTADKPLMGGQVKSCPLWPYRMRKGRPSVKAIRKHCMLLCANNSFQFVRECDKESCPLHPFRMGTNPNISEETRKRRAEQVEKVGFKSQK